MQSLCTQARVAANRACRTAVRTQINVNTCSEQVTVRTHTTQLHRLSASVPAPKAAPHHSTSADVPASVPAKVELTVIAMSLARWWLVTQ